MADDTIETVDGLTLKSDSDPDVRRALRAMREMMAVMQKHQRKSNLDQLTFACTVTANLAISVAESVRKANPEYQQNFVIALVNALMSPMDGGQLREMMDAGQSPKH